MDTNTSRLEKFKNTRSYKELVDKHNLNESGVWRVFGEDPNCEISGHHQEPELGLFSGVLDDIIEFAVDLPGFWEWGAGGRITKMKAPIFITHDVIQERRSDIERIKSLTLELEALKVKHNIK